MEIMPFWDNLDILIVIRALTHFWTRLRYAKSTLCQGFHLLLWNGQYPWLNKLLKLNGITQSFAMIKLKTQTLIISNATKKPCNFEQSGDQPTGLITNNQWVEIIQFDKIGMSWILITSCFIPHLCKLDKDHQFQSRWWEVSSHSGNQCPILLQEKKDKSNIKLQFYSN